MKILLPLIFFILIATLVATAQPSLREPSMALDQLEFQGKTVISVSELAALRLERDSLKARVLMLEGMIQELITQQQRGAGLRQPLLPPLGKSP